MSLRPESEAALLSGVGVYIKAGVLASISGFKTALDRLYCLNGSRSHCRNPWSGKTL